MTTEEESRIISVFKGLSEIQIDAMNWYAFDRTEGRMPIAPVCRFLVFVGLLDVFQIRGMDEDLIIERTFYRILPEIRSLWLMFLERAPTL
jgi:hypothetical protein